MSDPVPGAMPAGASGHHVAEAAERRWSWVVAAIIGIFVGAMLVTGVHWGAMPPSRVETIDSRTLAQKGEFVESNLGTTVGPDGKVTVRLVGQQYSFAPSCIVVPAGVPVTFRGTASDAVHGFVVGRTNANVMLVPGYVATFTTTFNTQGEMLMPCHEYCGTGHEGMWARVRVVDAMEFLRGSEPGKAVHCAAR